MGGRDVSERESILMNKVLDKITLLCYIRSIIYSYATRKLWAWRMNTLPFLGRDILRGAKLVSQLAYKSGRRWANTAGLLAIEEAAG